MDLDSAGHLFLAHGRLEAVVHDAAVVPTDRPFHLRRYWDPLLGPEPARHRPSDWGKTQYGRSPITSSVWFIDVGDSSVHGLATLIPRLHDLLATIAGAGLSPGAGRSKLRIAIPVLATSGGGMGSERGTVLQTLLDELRVVAHDLDVDLVLVTPEPSVFGAAQHVRRRAAAWPLTDNLVAHAARLGQLSRAGHLALFLGAGTSVSAGLPTWGGLLTELTEIAAGGTDLRDLPPLDQAQLLERRLGDKLGEHVADITNRASRPSLAHALLAGLRCNEVVTTNYDGLYETAVRATGTSVTSVLPWQVVIPGSPWVLKMHGDASRPSSIVLTRRHFVRYDAATRPAGSVLQSLLLTKHLLVVGASLDDDNVSRLVHEVDAFRRDSGLDGQVGTMLDISDDHARRELWSDNLSWLSLPGETIHDRARSLELFLDTVAAFASADHTWLLDERFVGLLSEPARSAAAKARELYKSLPAGDEVAALRDALQALGVSITSSSP